MNMIDNLIDNWKPPEVLKKFYSFGTTGSDKMGCQSMFIKYFSCTCTPNIIFINMIFFLNLIVWISAFGRTDVKGLLRSVSKRDYIRYTNSL